MFEIFKSGRHYTSTGTPLTFTEADVEASAKAYDPAVHEAPLVVGHPRMDDPAYGWVKGLKAANGTLKAEPRHVDPAFQELVKSGRFNKISAAFYAPDAPTNPKPGVYYLRHVGFLGAAAPAVKGLKPVTFAADEAGIVTFSEEALIQAGLWRRIREWIIAQVGLEKADTVVPTWELDLLESAAKRENPPAEAFAEPPPVPAPAPAPDAALAARAAELEAREAKVNAAEKALNEKSAHRETAAFLEKLVTEGKVLPRDQAGLLALLTTQPPEAKVEFGEGEDRVSQSSVEWLKAFLAAQPKQVEFGEVSAGALSSSDPEELARAARALMDAEEKAGRSMSISTAVRQIRHGK